MSSKHILIASFVFACVFARPNDSPPEKDQPTVIPIVSQTDELESNGTYKFSYETGDGIKREEIAYEKVLPKGKDASSKEEGENDDYSDEIHVQQGSYSYTAPDGTLITLRYIADENGFQPIGDHLPRSPVLSPALSDSPKKSGRASKAADSADSASTQVEAKMAKSAFKKPAETVMVADELLKTAPIANDSEMPAKKSKAKSEDNGPEPANINVSTEVASTAASTQSSTEASPDTTEQNSTSASENSAEVTESSSSTSAPEQSSSSEVVGQSTTTEAVSQAPAEEVQKPTTNAAPSAPVKGSDSTTVSA